MPLLASPDQIRKFSQDMHDKHAQIAETIARVDQQSDMTTATWQGQARNAFDNFMDRYFALARELNNQLQSTADDVARAGAAIGGADEQFHSQVSSLSL
jgi:WXG100 family type VII secretion target